MKTLIVCFVLWIFVVPVLAGVFLIFAFIATPVPDLYYAFTSLALSFSLVAIVYGLLRHDRLSSVSFHFFSRNRQSMNFVQEKKYENLVENSARS